MDKNRVRRILLWAGVALGLYAIAGFLVVPRIVKSQAVKHVDQELGHKLDLAEVRINPFTLSAELTGFELREASGASLVSFKRLFVDFQASSLIRRAWTFSRIEADAPAARFELRADGTHNFTALLAKLRKTPPEPDSPMPRLEIDSIRVTDGRFDVADLQAGPDAKLQLHPITFELTDLSTLPAESSPYKFTARSTEGELIQWGGEITLNPLSSTGKLALQHWRLATFDRLLGNRIGLSSASGELGLALDYKASFTQGKPSASLANAQLTIDGLALTTGDAKSPLANVGRLAVTGGSLDLAQRTASVERVELARGAFDLAIDAQGRANWSALALHAPASANEANTPPPPPTPSVDTATQPAPGSEVAAPWRIKIAQVAVSDLAVAFADARPGSAGSMSFKQGRIGLSAAMQIGPQGPAITLESLTAGVSDVALMQGVNKAGLAGVELSANKATLQSGDDKRTFGLETLRVGLQKLTAQQGTRSVRSDAAQIMVQTIDVALAQGAGGTMSARIDGPAIETTGIAARTGAKGDAVELKRMTAGAKLVQLDGDAIKGDDLRAALDGLVVRDPASLAEMARIGKVEAAGGSVATAQRTASLERISVTDAAAATVMGTDGKLNWEALFAALESGDAPKPAAPPRTSNKPADIPWNIAAKLVEVNKLGATYSDQRQQPVLAVGVVDVSAKVRNAATQSKAPATIELAGRVRDAGQFRAAGSVDMKSLAADVKLKVEGLALTPAQPLIARLARLQLVSALASAEGRLRYGRTKEAGADIVYEGDLGLDKVIVEETEPAAPFLSLDAMRATQMKLALGPNSLDIPDLRLNRLVTKLLIAEDQTVNLAKVVRPTPADAGARPAAAPAAKPAGADADDAFPISIARIRFDNSVVEFSDLSLRPQLFNTRMHELKGVVTGVSTSRESRARLELDARVDEFGAASIRGAINPFKPRSFTEVDLDFRNIAMTNLTPYSSKFAGYRIASGTMHIDLQYRVRNSALQGNNKIVLDKLELGERVESPSALNLPLELAIAILKDSDGRIDIGLPVSGSLDDPQFSIGGLVWKAIGNLLTKIVTAPFRALASLFGGGENDTLGAIEFDAGSDALRPPERQKLRTVAEALQKRAQLKLTVKPTFAAAADADALKSIAVRRAILTRAGIKLEPGESPGPLDVGNARMQQAIDALYVERFGNPAARDLRASLSKPAPAPQPQAADGGKPGTAPVAPATLQAIRIARAMSDRLIESAAISEAELADLARRRGAAVVAELRDSAKVDPARVASSDPRRSEAKENGPVVTELDLAVAK